jgi:hypothetical protein
MASSVSSKRAFSQGGITINKLRSRLKGDIVEALQCVKCILRHDLIFREPDPSSAEEADLSDDDDNSLEEDKNKEDDESSWDVIIDGDDVLALDDEDDEDFDVDIDSGEE